MATVTVVGTEQDSQENPLSGLNVTAQLYPPGIICYSPDGSIVEAVVVSTQTNAEGQWSLTLERTDTMAPSGMVYLVSRQMGGVFYPQVSITVPEGGGVFQDLFTSTPGPVPPGTGPVGPPGGTGSGMTNPMTTADDIIVGGSGGAPTRLGVGASGDVLGVTSGSVGWVVPSGGFTPTLTLVSSSNASFPIPSGATFLRLTGVGGGGGGGGGGSSQVTTPVAQGGGGGGAAGCAQVQLFSVGSVTTLDITIGAAGAAGTASTAGSGATGYAGGNGGTGGNTTVTATGLSLHAQGGSGGNASGASTATGGSGALYGNGFEAAASSLSLSPGSGGPGGQPSPYPAGSPPTGGGGGGAASATAASGGTGGAAGGLTGSAAAGTAGGSGTGAGTSGSSAAANSGAGGGGGGGGSGFTSGAAGGAGGAGGSGYVIVEAY